jgi:predicted MFS family arabinose efflux permease
MTERPLVGTVSDVFQSSGRASTQPDRSVPGCAAACFIRVGWGRVGGRKTFDRRRKGFIVTSTSEMSLVRSSLTVTFFTLTGVLAVGQAYIVLGMLNQIADEFRVTPAGATTLTTVFGVTYAVGFLLTGPLATRFGVRSVLIIGLVCAAVAALVVATVPSSLEAALIVRAVQGLLTASFAPCALVYVSQQFPPRQRTFATTGLTTAFLASAIVMPLLAGPAAEAWGWRGVFTASGLALLTCAFALAFLLRRDEPRAVSLARAFLVLPRILRLWPLVALYGATAAVLGCYIALFTALQLSHSTAVADFPGGLQGLRIATVPGLILMTVVAGLMHRVPSWRRATGGFVLAALGAAAILIAGPNPAILGTGVVVFAAAIALTAPALVARIVETSPPGATAAATAWYGAFMFIGGSLGPILAAPASGPGLPSAVLIVIAVALTGAALVLVTRYRAARVQYGLAER